LNVPAAPPLTLAGLQHEHPGWEITQPEPRSIWAVKRGADSALRTSALSLMALTITAFEQATAVHAGRMDPQTTPRQTCGACGEYEPHACTRSTAQAAA
jgi:hypothetical protein